MSQITPLELPTELPHPEAIRTCGRNEVSYEPQMWELEYHANRYLVNMSDDDLRKRYFDLRRNMLRLIIPPRNAIPIHLPLSSWFWYRKEHQTRLEFNHRNLSEPDGDSLESALKTRRRTGKDEQLSNAGSVLYRYGRRPHLCDWLEGKIRLSAASTFIDVECDDARQDDEKEKACFSPGQQVRISLPNGREVTPIGDVKYTKFYRASDSQIDKPKAADYFVLCLSSAEDDELAVDFAASAFVRISNVDEFARRIQIAGERQLPNAVFTHNPVEYYDPQEHDPNQRIDTAMSKPFRFAYQQEYRFVWLDYSGQPKKKHLELVIERLDDIAEMTSV